MVKRVTARVVVPMAALAFVWAMSSAACGSSDREFTSGNQGGGAGAAAAENGGKGGNAMARPGGGAGDALAEAGQGGSKNSSGGSSTAAVTGGSLGTAGSMSPASGGQSGGSVAQGGTGGTDERLGSGQVCATNEECASDFCRDDVCCEAACEGACEACAQAHTGEPDGTCAPVLSGEDPHDDCETEAGESCGTDGTCDGAGACRHYGPNQVCAAASCSGSDHSPARTCDGAGACEAPTPVPCGDSPCSDSGCENPCENHPDCPNGSYCDSPLCRNKKPDGQACAVADECRSGFCADGVCCEGECKGACAACSQAKTGQPSGRCVGVPAGQDPDNECAVDSGNACGLDGACTGGGACRLASLGTTCGTASCSGTTLTPQGACDGASGCSRSTPQECPNNFTCLSATACRTTCTMESHCIAGHYCSGGSCLRKKERGGTCEVGGQCSSGFCKDGTCCESACSLACQGCSNGTTGLANGTCGARSSSATKPCPTSNPTTCVDLRGDPNNCGACGSSCPAVPNTNPSCSNGNCSYSCKNADYQLACLGPGGKPSCSNWDFEVANESDGWKLRPPTDSNENGSTGLFVSSTERRLTGNRSLAIGYNKPAADGQRFVDLVVEVCPNAQSVNLAGKTLRWSVYSSMPAGGHNWVWMGLGASGDHSNGPSNTWNEYSFLIPEWETAVTAIGFHFEITEAISWNGVIYLDNVRISTQ